MGRHAIPIDAGFARETNGAPIGKRISWAIGGGAIAFVLHRIRRRGTQVAKSIVIYGIKNCDTMKKARAWLDEHGILYSFHDYKSAGIDRARLELWCQNVGWQALLNRAGKTFRNQPEKDKAGLDAKKAVALMLAQPSMIKRPVLDLGGGKILVGFAPDVYAQALPKS
jgi:arsenate reductase (glutaredoxin)